MYILECRKFFKSIKHTKYMNKWLEILLGLILVAGTIYAVWAWPAINGWGMGKAAFEFFKGGIVWFVIIIGLLFLMLGISDLRD